MNNLALSNRKEHKKITALKSIFVQYSNVLNTFDLSSLNVIQKRFFFLILALARYKKEDNLQTTIKITGDEIKNYTNLGNYTEQEFDELMLTARDAIFSLSFELNNEKGKGSRMHFVSKLDWDLNQKYIEVMLDDDCIENVFNLEGGKFTAFEIEEFSNLQGSLAQVIYQVMKQWKTKGVTPEVPLDELRKLSGLNNTRKDQFVKFIKNALVKIEEKTSFEDIKYEFTKNPLGGRGYQNIIIYFKRQNIRQIDKKNDEIIENIKGLTNDKYEELKHKYGGLEVEQTKKRMLTYKGTHTVEELEQWLNEKMARKKEFNNESSSFLKMQSNYTDDEIKNIERLLTKN